MSVPSTSRVTLDDDRYGDTLASATEEQRQGTTLLFLPTEVLELIGYYTAVAPPAEQTAAQATGGGDDRTYGKLSADADGDDPLAFATPPVHLRNFLLTCRTINRLLNARTNHSLYAAIFRSRFDTGAIERRFGKRAVACQTLTEELQRRCVILKRIRRSVDAQSIASSQNTSADVNEDTEAQEERASRTTTEILENFWLAFMMLTENDGLNIRQLRQAQIDAYLRLYRTQDILVAAMRHGYPDNTPARSLAVHLDYLLTRPQKLANETREESAEKLFILRPYIFAAHRYDAFLAPWTLKNPPVTQGTQSSATRKDGASSSASAPSSNPFVADLALRDDSVLLQYCGRQLTIRPPNITHAACSSFFMKVERDPGVSGPLSSLDQASDLSDDSDSDASQSPSPSAARHRTTSGDERYLCTKDPLSLTSKDHDLDVSRLMLCASPYTSSGLEVSDHIGSMQGSWEGRFTFFDFDSYRDMLGGKVRALYEGPFGEQPQVWKIKEHVVKVRSSEVGGKGSILNGGYLNEDPEPNEMVPVSQATLEELRAAASGSKEAARHSYPSSSSASSSRRSSLSVLGKRGIPSDWSSDDARASSDRAEQSGTMPPKEILDDWENYPSFDHEKESEDNGQAGGPEGSQEADATALPEDAEPSVPTVPTEHYEILLSGEGHSAWGKFLLRGRIRTWDGLVTLAKEYKPDGRGRWLYRGYVVAGNKLVGRWRDTFTPEHMSGYEGCYLLQRRGT